MISGHFQSKQLKKNAIRSKIEILAAVVELVDTLDSESSGYYRLCWFESSPRHHIFIGKLMNLVQTIIYGVVQGVGEFLPISSSAHLVAIPQIFGWQDPGLAFDVALHIGTLVAVISFFWKDWINLIKSGIKGTKTVQGKLFWYIVIASIPGAIVGKLLEKKAETIFRNIQLIGIMLIMMGILLYFVDKYGKKMVNIDKIGLKKSFLIGISQALAIIPGVSRSGITMTTGLLLGLTRESAARFSFLLSTPIILGAGILKFKAILHTPHTEIPLVILGVIIAAITGFISIKFLLSYLKTNGYGIFVIYRIIVGVALIGISFTH